MELSGFYQKGNKEKKKTSTRRRRRRRSGEKKRGPLFNKSRSAGGTQLINNKLF
jgi:ribosomal protein L32